MLGYLFIALVIMATVAALGTLVVQNLNFAQRRQNIVNARQVAQAGAAICAREVEQAFTNGGGGLISNLTATLPKVYAMNSALSSDTQLVYERTITDPFTNQTVLAQVVDYQFTNSPKGRIHRKGDGGPDQPKQRNQYGNDFRCSGGDHQHGAGRPHHGHIQKRRPGWKRGGGGIEQGPGKSGWGNRCERHRQHKRVLGRFRAGNLYASAGQLPDYTNPGSPKQLFDFNRYIAVADKSANHYTNFASFAAAAKVSTKAAPLQGIVVVDFNYAEKSKISMDGNDIPEWNLGPGTLVVNYAGGWSPTDKIINTAACTSTGPIFPR